MSNIAFLGLGAMGSRMAPHLLSADHHLRAWNRDTHKVLPLVSQGALSPVSCAVKKVFGNVVDNGHAASNISGIAQLYL